MAGGEGLHAAGPGMEPEECSGLAPRRGHAFGVRRDRWKALARAGALRPSRRAGEDAVGAHMRGKNPCRFLLQGLVGTWDGGASIRRLAVEVHGCCSRRYQCR